MVLVCVASLRNAERVDRPPVWISLTHLPVPAAAAGNRCRGAEEATAAPVETCRNSFSTRANRTLARRALET